MTLRFRYVSRAVPVFEIPRLCTLTRLPIGELRTRIAKGLPLFEVTAFENDWQQSREHLVYLVHEIENGSLHLSISELEEGEDETPLTPEDLRGVLLHYREIELQSQRSEDPRMGVIHDASEFEPHDDDWTQQPS